VNVLTLFGLVLAVRIVVDDAIVVVENVDRHLRIEPSVQRAAADTMLEVGGALLSIALVLCAVFVPTAFLEGITGRFFRQFAITIAVATALSCFCSLTLSPALATLILRQHEPHPAPRRPAPARLLRWLLVRFNRGFDRLARAYAGLTRQVAGRTVPMLALYALLIFGAGWLLARAPQGFLPAQDRGYATISIELPGGASLARTTAVVEAAASIARAVPGIASVSALAGVSGATNTAGGNQGMLTPVFAPWDERLPQGLTAERIMRELRHRLEVLEEAAVLVIPPPAVPGLGSGGGFALRLEDRTGRGTAVLAAATDNLVAMLGQMPGLVGVYSPFRVDAPLVAVDVDRARIEMLGVPVARLSQSIETLLGSSYVNDFTAYGRNWRVVAQASPEFRRLSTDLARVFTRNADREMVPLANVMALRDIIGPQRVPRYNLYPAAEIAGEIRAGTGSAAANAVIERVARRLLPDGIGFEWTDLSYEQTQSGNAGLLVFPLCVLFVYLVLAAQYGSWSLPFAVILIVPMCLLTSTLGVRLLGQDVNILTQIGFVVLVGLAAKNAILIVEFAQQREDEGQGALDAVVEACQLRLRAILMTSLAFILGVLPLVIASGAGAEMRRAVGTAVFFGMMGVTAFGLLFTPVFYVTIRKLVGPRRSALREMSRQAR
jgi:hydrophobe/amphiphile efflux-1 (HAE1) family protein